MRLYSLIGLVWDQPEGAWIPVNGITHFRPFLTGGICAFRRHLEARYGQQTAQLLCVTEIEKNAPTTYRFHGIRGVALMSHNLTQYTSEMVARYISEELQHDLAQRS